ncbi:hypothetical protein JHK85_044359 [Glycine max]|nr:hypothetical protein JHK85_044359 [Glycine max]
MAFDAHNDASDANSSSSKWVIKCPCMYVDGSCQGNPCNAGFGGLLRDAMGTWIHGFYGDIGQTDITKEELLAILNGLKIAWERNLDNVLCVTSFVFGSE